MKASSSAAVMIVIACCSAAACKPSATENNSMNSNASSTGPGVRFGEEEVDQSLFLAMAVVPPNSPLTNLIVIEQKLRPNQRNCWKESGQDPVMVEPLLLSFDFTGYCGRSTDTNGYQVRVDGVDRSVSFRLRKQANDIILVGQPFDGTNDFVIGRTHGIGNTPYSKIQLEPGWRFSKRTFEGKTLGVVYFSYRSP